MWLSVFLIHLAANLAALSSQAQAQHLLHSADKGFERFVAAQEEGTDSSCILQFKRRRDHDFEDATAEDDSVVAPRMPSPPLAPMGHKHEIAEHSAPVARFRHHRTFGLCPKQPGGAATSGFAVARAKAKTAALAVRGQGQAHVRSSKGRVSCDEGTVIGTFSADHEYEESCCTLQGYCGGCAVVEEGKCTECAAGYTFDGSELERKCVACDDVPDWLDATEKTCIDYEIEGRCSNGQPPIENEPFEGLRPSDACCACGGGQLAPTPWSYKLSEQVLVFGSQVSARPSPETAPRYEVSPSCKLGDLNIIMSPGGVLSGKLPSFEEDENGILQMSCEVVAVQDIWRGIQANAQLELSLQPMSYGPRIVTFAFNEAFGQSGQGVQPTGKTSWELSLGSGLALSNFTATCVPAVPWISVDPTTGTLNYLDDGSIQPTGGLSGDYSGLDGGECSLKATTATGAQVEAAFGVLKVPIWHSMMYSGVVHARRGRPIVPLPLLRTPPDGYSHRLDTLTGREYWYETSKTGGQEIPVPPSIRPVPISVKCSGHDQVIRWSRQTGTVTVGGRTAFIINPVTGDISGTPELNLPQQYGQSSLTVTCYVAATGAAYDVVLTTSVEVRLVDDICFFPQDVQDPVWAHDETGAAHSCATSCRRREDCGAYWTSGQDCYLQTSAKASDAILHSPESILIRAQCEEGVSCLQFKDSSMAFLKGKFCPKGHHVETSASVYFRDGMTAADGLFMQRVACPLPGRVGNWVVHRASEKDHIDPSTGAVELRGEVVACIAEDVETKAFMDGSVSSTVWLPDAALTAAQYATFEAENAASRLTITASLTAHSCSPPQVESDSVIFGTPSDPSAYSLSACECFGAHHRDTQPVTADSVNAIAVVRSSSDEYNAFVPSPQLLFEGPYVCETGALLPSGQKNEIDEDECLAECMGFGSACRFFTYVPQLRFCQLLSKCERIGHTGLDISHRVFGVFHDDSNKYCRIADPEACWVSVRRRQLLDGHLLGDDGCAFEQVLRDCDTMQMVSTESHGVCARCAYYPLTSPQAAARSKRPLPQTFTSGSQISVGCDMDVSRLLSLQTGEQMKHAVLTCVDGSWRDKDGNEGMEKLSCTACVQVAQPSYSEYLRDSSPELYFLARRQLQYHFGHPSSGCRIASEATSAPLRSAQDGRCLFHDASTGSDCSDSWFLTLDGNLMLVGATTGCLFANEQNTVKFSLGCHVEARLKTWRFSQRHHLVHENKGTCLTNDGAQGLQLASCSSDILPKQEWYFDGGDCRHTMHLRSTGNPLLWNFEFTGNAYLGIELGTQEDMELSVAKTELDEMAFGSCRVSLSTRLATPDENLNDQLDLEIDDGASVSFNHAFTYEVNGETVFVCPPGAGGVKKLLSKQFKKAELDAKLEALRNGCDAGLKASRPDVKAGGFENDWDQPFSATAPLHSVISGLFSEHLNRDEDRRWRVKYSRVEGIDISSESEWSAESQWDDPFSLECPPGWVITGLASHHDNGREDRKYKIQCSKVLDSSKMVLHEWGDYLNDYDDKLEFNPAKNRFIVGFGGVHSNTDEDRKFNFRLATFCEDKTDEITELEGEIAALAESIEDISTTLVSCAADFMMEPESFRALDVSYHGSVDIEKTASAKCHLLKRGDPGDSASFVLSASQMTEMARSIGYYPTQASNPKDPPFRSKSNESTQAAKVGWFAMIDKGAALWGLQCKPGSVVAVHSHVGSPHCVHVNAAFNEDLPMITLLPATANCDLGYAVGGWYNLDAREVQERTSGGPHEPTGFEMICRPVPGLTRVCETKENRCEADEVVSGVAYERGLAIKYRCCKVPRTVGKVFANAELLDVESWEGYYCPAALNDNGRAAYEWVRAVRGTSISTKDAWPLVHRSTPPRYHKNGEVIYLDRHQPSCEPGEAMTGWKVHKAGTSKIVIAFSCLKLGFDPLGVSGTTKDGCHTHSTSKSPESLHVKLLANFDVSCPQGSALLWWRFDRVHQGTESTDNSIVFRCCGFVSDSDERTTLHTNSLQYMNERLDELDRHSVTCKPGQVLVGFKMEVLIDLQYFVMQCQGAAMKIPLQGESQSLRWNQFHGTWVLAQVPVVERRSAVTDAGFDYLPWRGHMSCEAGFALQGFRFHNHGGNLLSSAARCRATSLGDCDTHVLDTSDLDLNCGDQKVMQSWIRIVNKHLEITCCAAPSLGDCMDRETDLEPVKCDEGFVLQRFNVTNSEHGFSYMHRCCKEEGTTHEVGGVFSSSANPQDEPIGQQAGPLRAKLFSSGSTADFWIHDVKVTGERGKGLNIITVDPTSRQVTPVKVFDVSGGESQQAADFLNNLVGGTTVLVVVNETGMESLSAQAVFALQRCGARLVQPTDAGRLQLGYVLIGVVGGEAAAELFADSVDAEAVAEVELPESFAAAPFVDFPAAFVQKVSRADPFPKEKPLKPQLLSFSSTQPDYDKFCDVTTRTESMATLDCDDSECPEIPHPCYHTYQNHITEDKFWECSQRDIDRSYVAGIAEVQQAQMEAQMNKLDKIFAWVEMGAGLAAAAIGAIPWGSYAVPSEKGAEEGTKSAQKTTKTAAEGIFRKKASKMVLAFRDLKRKLGKTKLGNLFKATKQKLKDNTLKASLKAAGAIAPQIEGKIKKAVVGAKSRSNADKSAYNSDVAMIGPEGDEVRAIPELLPPDLLGFNSATNAETVAYANWIDCDPVQNGLSKMMCDLYCTENAVKEGNQATINNIRDSNTVLMTNVERLLDYHTQTVLWGMGQLRDQLKPATLNQQTDGLLLWRAEDGEETPGQGQHDFGQMQSALQELHALPQLLEMNATPLEAHAGVQGVFAPSVADWHREASQALVDRLQAILRNAASKDLPQAVDRARALVQKFSAERSWQLRGLAPQRHEAVQRMVTKKAETLRGHIRGHVRRLQLASTAPSPMQKLAGAAVAFASDDVIIRWNQLVDAFVAAHEKHAVFVEARARALAAAEEVVRDTEHYIGCDGKELVNLQEVWHRALRVEDHAADALLESWASTVAAQERLQIAVDFGLPGRIAASAVLQDEDAASLPCQGGMALLAERAHQVGTRSVDRALWPLLEQVLLLERFADLQQREMVAKGLRGVERLPVTPTLSSLYAVAAAAADPKQLSGRALAARTLDTLGPKACPAPAGCQGMLLINDTHGRAWTSQRPGLLLLEGYVVKDIVKACTQEADRGSGGNLEKIVKDLVAIVKDLQRTADPSQPVVGLPALPEISQSPVCGEDCAEQFKVNLTQKKSSVRDMVRLLR